MPAALEYNVTSIRATGAQAKWGKTRTGRPCIFARLNDGKPWYLITAGMWTDAQTIGFVEAFENHTLLGDFFSIPA